MAHTVIEGIMLVAETFPLYFSPEPQSQHVGKRVSLSEASKVDRALISSVSTEM